MVVHIKFKEKNKYEIEYEKGMSYNKKKKIREYFKILFENMILPTKGSIIFFQGEHCTYAGSWCRRLNLTNDVIFSWSEVGNINTILPAYNILTNNKSNIDEVEYEDKKERCVYRFSVLYSSREKCVEISKRNEMFDIKWIYKDDIPENKNHKYKKYKKKIKNHMSIEEMLEYKVQLDCYGWEAFYWKCKSNCVVLRWCDPFERTFIDNYLKPNYHYFCVNENNLETTMEYVINNPKICKKMIEERKKIMDELTIEKMKKDAVKTIHEYINTRIHK